MVSGERAMVAVLFALRAFAKQMLLLYQSLRCVSCLSVPSKMRCKGLDCLAFPFDYNFGFHEIHHMVFKSYFVFLRLFIIIYVYFIFRFSE